MGQGFRLLGRCSSPTLLLVRGKSTQLFRVLTHALTLKRCPAEDLNRLRHRTDLVRTVAKRCVLGQITAGEMGHVAGNTSERRDRTPTEVPDASDEHQD